MNVVIDKLSEVSCNQQKIKSFYNFGRKVGRFKWGDAKSLQAYLDKIEREVFREDLSEDARKLKFVQISSDFLMAFFTVHQLEKKLGDAFSVLEKERDKLLIEVDSEFEKAIHLSIFIMTKEGAKRQIVKIFETLV